jgi:hypothetical protein
VRQVWWILRYHMVVHYLVYLDEFIAVRVLGVYDTIPGKRVGARGLKYAYFKAGSYSLEDFNLPFMLGPPRVPDAHTLGLLHAAQAELTQRSADFEELRRRYETAERQLMTRQTDMQYYEDKIEALEKQQDAGREQLRLFHKIARGWGVAGAGQPTAGDDRGARQAAGRPAPPAEVRGRPGVSPPYPDVSCRGVG